MLSTRSAMSSADPAHATQKTGDETPRHQPPKTAVPVQTVVTRCVSLFDFRTLSSCSMDSRSLRPATAWPIMTWEQRERCQSRTFRSQRSLRWQVSTAHSVGGLEGKATMTSMEWRFKPCSESSGRNPYSSVGVTKCVLR
eukprot:2181309-Rhodomonas_salina.1